MNTIFDEIARVRPDLISGQIRGFLGRFLFSGDDVLKPVGALSGGELSRVAIAKLVLSDANLLLLDEPTNHLDIASREALDEALDQFTGTMVLVSHDRALIDRLATKLVVFEQSAVSVHLGNYARYREWQSGQAGAPPANADPAAQPSSDVMKVRRTRRLKTRSERRERENSLRRKQRQLDEVEGDIEALEEHIETMESQFAGIDPDNYEQARSLREEYDGLKRDLAELYEHWERLAEALAE